MSICRHHVQAAQAALNDIQHDDHDVVISAQHVHLDLDNSLDMLATRRQAGTINETADELITAKGVRHGKLTATTSGNDLPARPNPARRRS